jgi:hypothetical protein
MIQQISYLLNYIFKLWSIMYCQPCYAFSTKYLKRLSYNAVKFWQVTSGKR